MAHSHGTEWNDEKMKSALFEVMNAYEIDYMPSNKMIADYFHNYSLTNAIVRKKGGFYSYAKELGLPIKSSETSLGKRLERETRKILFDYGFQSEQMPMRFPYDLLVEDFVKVDVKASHLYKGKVGNFYTFNLEKDCATCDIYILHSLSSNNEIVNSYVIPSKFVMKNNQISIGQTSSKYHIFKDRWDYIKQYANYFKSIS